MMSSSDFEKGKERSKVKAILLGALFHDIGKFEQICTGNPNKKPHTELGREFVLKFRRHFETIVGQDHFDLLSNIIFEHHNNDGHELIQIVKEADSISGAAQLENEEIDSRQNDWSHRHLCTPFNRIRLYSSQELEPRYYRHIPLSRKDYDIILPRARKEIEKENSYSMNDFENFELELKVIFDSCSDDNDFDTLINLLLVAFEKYLWCIPNFCGNPETGVSLYNHLKDVAALAHAIFLSNSTNLRLIICDLPGIQEYIFNIANRKPAKILRGRSIFVQLLTRKFATTFLQKLGLTEVSLIMHAGGKFYIVAPDSNGFEEIYNEAKKEVEQYLFKEFAMDLSFNCAHLSFDYRIDKDFGRIIELATHELSKNKHRFFEHRLFHNSFPQDFIWKEEYIQPNETGTNSIKCEVTERPIKEGRKEFIEEFGEKIQVDHQVKIEYEIGSKIPQNHIFQDNICLNPKLTLEDIQDGKLKNICFLDVANYCSKNDDDNGVLDFEGISKYNEGAEFLTLIKGDIDNLGLIMAHGLTRDNNEKETVFATLTSITTLSYHLKYYFSFFLNGFLENWESKSQENKVYTIFAGGDDVMLITPQSSAIKLLEEFNNKFNDFICGNPEVHISFSVTHFKHHTPIRIVADIAEENQKSGKQKTINSQTKLLLSRDSTSFHAENDKAGTFVFDTFIENTQLHDYNRLVHQVVDWVEKKNIVTRGLIQKLLDASELIRQYRATGNGSFLIWYARLNYTINRLLKDRQGRYRDELVGRFFDSVLVINKDAEEQKLDKMLYPLICQIIYKIRK